MTDLTIPASPAPLDVRAGFGGGICLLCRLCADHGLPHACITEAGPIDGMLLDLPRGVAEPLMTRLAVHPARPLTDQGERRGVDRTWCCCGCQPTGGRPS